MYIFRLNKNFFMYKGVPKAMLRNSMRENFPPEIKNNFEKTGFYSPFRSFFKKKDMSSIKKYLLNSKISNNDGFVFGLRDIPQTFAPSITRRRVIQLPLKPVCPVTRTRRP